MTHTLTTLHAELKQKATPERAKVNAWFFKTKPGQYGHGDTFIGVTVPDVRSIVKRHRDACTLADAEACAESAVHEERLLGLLILVEKYKKTNDKGREGIYRLYLKLAKKYVNNWDLVDLSSHAIVGEYLRTHEDDIATLEKLAHSHNLWERRIAIVSTYAFIRAGEVEPTMRIASLLMRDTHDLIHKAVGWMLRESWKREPEKIEAFLIEYRSIMPRTTLRYAIERMELLQRKEFMAK